MIFVLEREEKFFIFMETHNRYTSQQTYIPALRKNLLPWIIGSNHRNFDLNVSGWCRCRLHVCTISNALRFLPFCWPLAKPSSRSETPPFGSEPEMLQVCDVANCAISFQPHGRTNSIKNNTPDNPRPIQPLHFQPWMVWSCLYVQIHHLSFMALRETSKQALYLASTGLCKSLLSRSWRTLEGRVSTTRDELRNARNLWIDPGHGSRHAMIYWLLSFSGAEARCDITGSWVPLRWYSSMFRSPCFLVAIVPIILEFLRSRGLSWNSVMPWAGNQVYALPAMPPSTPISANDVVKLEQQTSQMINRLPVVAPNLRKSFRSVQASMFPCGICFDVVEKLSSTFWIIATVAFQGIVEGID